MKISKEKFKKYSGITLVIVSGLILGADFIYKTINDITYYTREKCILYLKLPKTGFLIYEYFLELFMVVVIGIFLAVLLEKYFNRYKKFYPKNPVTAFIYASIIPVCACTTIPLVQSLKDKLRFNTLITFIIAAPLLNPYIIVLSFSVLGIRYGVLRIVCSFILAICAGYILNFFYRKFNADINTFTSPTMKNKQACPIVKKDLFTQTFDTMVSILPFIIVAAILGILVELYVPVDFLRKYDFSNNITGLLLIITIGIPIYYCHGADVLLLKPLIVHSGLETGTAMAFSLTSTAICVTSAVLLIKFMGKKLTVILFASVFIITLVMGLILNLIFM